MSSNRRLLISYAHPDDESFGNGGLIGKYVAEGVDVYLICATNGDVGSIPPEFEGRYASVAELRIAELEASNAILKLKHIYRFNYRDSGMMGSEHNQHPASLWHQWHERPAHVVQQVVDVIREVQPQVIITFNKYGGYGHPDHIAIQQATTQAFTLASDPHYTASALPPYAPQKLYYSGLPAGFLRTMGAWWRLRGKDLRKMGRNGDIDYQAIIDNIEPQHARIDISAYFDIWDAASRCHASQGGGGTMSRIPRWLRPILAGKQGFTRVYPAPSSDAPDEQDLFTGVQAAPIQTAVKLN